MEKKRISLVGLMVFALLLMGTFAWAVPETVNYQGMLTDAEVPLEGIYDMEFFLLDVPSGGTSLWSESQVVEVEGGSYNVQLGSSTPLSTGLFGNDELYLEVRIYNTDTATWETLTPRQPYGSVPFAMKAGSAENFGGIPAGDILTSTQPSDITLGTTGNAFGVTNLGDGPAVVGSSSSSSGVVGYTGGDVGVAAVSGNAWNGDVTGITYGGWFNSSSDTGIGVQGESPGQNGIGVKGWAPGSSGTGVWGITDGQYGIAVRAEANGSSGMAVRGDTTSIYGGETYGGVFTSAGARGIGVYGYSSGEGEYAYGGKFEANGAFGRGVFGHSSSSNGVGVVGGGTAQGDVVNHGGYFWSDGDRGQAVFGGANATGDFANHGAYFTAAGDQGKGLEAWASAQGDVMNFGGVFYASGNQGRGIYAEAPGVGVEATAYGDQSRGVSASASGAHGRAVEAYTTDETPNDEGNQTAGYFTAAGPGWGIKTYGVVGIYAEGHDYWQQGTGVGIRAKGSGYAADFYGKVVIRKYATGDIVMKLGDGLDYAEGFDVSNKSAISPGSVLVIDAENPGKLELSSQPYDSKVAGIVAGAKNLGSGVRLGSDQFDHDVALAGRVYCNVAATNVDVRPGDLLTTSNTPGYAMKVTDHTRAHGTILGKAMEGLEKGKKGQILVLVTLQ